MEVVCVRAFVRACVRVCLFISYCAEMFTLMLVVFSTLPRVAVIFSCYGNDTSLCCAAGKSTVAALLERFYDPSSGVVMLDGLDIRTLDPSWLRGHVIGFISQARYNKLSVFSEHIERTLLKQVL